MARPCPIGPDDGPAIDRILHLAGLLKDPTRLRIVLAVREAGRLSVTALCGRLKIPQPLCSHHLAALRLARVVESTRDGRSNLYSEVPGALEPLAGLAAGPRG